MIENKSRRTVMATTVPPQGGDRPLRLHQTVYTAEYDGQSPRVMLTEEGAKAACEEWLQSEKELPVWDWVPDESGWEMRAVDPDTDAPLWPLGGRVTKTHLEQ